MVKERGREEVKRAPAEKQGKTVACGYMYRCCPFPDVALQQTVAVPMMERGIVKGEGTGPGEWKQPPAVP